MLFLCLQGAMMLLGLSLLLITPTSILGKDINGWRKWAMGLLLFIQTPLSLTLGQILLGSTEPGPIDGAAVLDARNRIAATCAEWTILSGSVLACFIIWLRAPETEERQLIEQYSPYKEDHS